MTKLILPLLLILCVPLGCGKGSEKDLPEPEASGVWAELAGSVDVPSLRELAEKGDVKAQAKLGDKYFSGEGVDENGTKAFKWWMKAALQGDAGCQYNVGHELSEVRLEGIEEDRVTGMAWIIIGAKNGFPPNSSLGGGTNFPVVRGLLKKMTPDQITESEALAEEMIKKNPKLIKKKK